MNVRTMLWPLLSMTAIVVAAMPAAQAAPLKLQTEKIIVLRPGGTGAVSGEFVTTKNSVPKEPTSAGIVWETTGLRVRFDCTDSNVTAAERARDFPEIWRDDTVELFIDRDHTHRDSSAWKHYIVNAAGGVFDESGPTWAYFSSGDSLGGNRKFDSCGLVAKATRTTKGWQAELFIPWTDLGGAPRAGDVWGFNLARGNQPSNEYSCFAPTHGSFYNMHRWGHLVFDKGGKGRGEKGIAAVAARHRELLATHRQENDAKQCLAPMPTLGKTWVELKGQVYGAKPDERGPLGGGAGYTAIVTGGDYVVSSLDELLAALKQAKAGQTVFIPGDAEIDCTVRTYIENLVIPIPAGVTLASDRGAGGSSGALIYSDTFETSPLLRAMDAGVRITGLRLRGPDPEPRLDLHQASARMGLARDVPGGFDSKYYYRFPTSRGIEAYAPGLTVDNCELAGWSHAAVFLEGSDGHHIHHNYIHHNQRNGLGYGVSLGYGDAKALIEYNVFNYNRHSIAATGVPGNAYEARHNVEVEYSLSHCFDMHGGSDRKDGTDVAGDWMKVSNNTFLGGSKPLRIRGVPVQEAQIYRNWFPHHRPDASGPQTPVDSLGKARIYDNAYGLEKPELLDGKIPAR